MTTLWDRVIRRSGYIFVFIVALLAAVGCVKDSGLPGGEGGGDDGEALVRLTIWTPGVSAPRPAMTRADTEAEYAIGTVKVLVLERRDDGRYYYRYMTDGRNITPQEGQKTTFQALLKATSAPVKILLAANYGDAFPAFLPEAGTPEDELRKAMVSTFSYSEGMQLPMYAEVTLDRLDTATTNTISATMLRAVARADISAELDMAVSKSFEITEAYVYRARKGIQLAPDADALTGSASPRVDTPSVPSQDTVARYGISTFDPLSVGGLYIPECATVGEESARLRGVTCLVVGGLYDGEMTPVYYRIDFDSGVEGHPYGQVLRNHCYRFAIKQVTGRGWEDPDDAANNRATTIVTEVGMWEDFTTEMIANGDNYLGVSSRDVVLPYLQGAERSLYVQASVPYRVSWSDRPGVYATAGGEPVSNGYFTASVEELPGVSDDASRIVITTLQENNGTENYVSELTVEWGTWVFTVRVTQLHYVVNVERSVRVLSVFNGTTGHLGDNVTAASGAGMRAVLSDAGNFSPRGVVDYFAGFDFSLARDQAAFMDPDGTNDATFRMHAMLYGTDVVYMGNDNRLSEAAARAVMQWLEASPNRVLVVGADAPLTSHNLIRRDKPYAPLAYDALWYYNATHLDSYNVQILENTDSRFLTVERTADNAEFTDGPFGPVTAGTPITIADGYYGYARSWYDGIIPLMTVKSHPDCMAVGVDPGKRIVYLGDASLYQTGRFTGPDGGDGMNARLWSNIWAWIAHQVIWGDGE
ncbi:MAG: hypothetical protein LIO85_00880 [Rikenellaceae bacterium]|nr:hypothetical protein [Rikenellaceae bacterium]